MNILDEIIQNKKEEVKSQKDDLPIRSLEELIKTNSEDEIGQERRDIYDALSRKNSINIIAEIKKSSPSKGVILEDFKPVELAHDCQMGGASAISVLTDEKFFEGKLAYLNSVRAVTEIPLLRKDFIIDEYQILESKIYKADAILLIASILNDKQITKFIKIADEIGLDCIIETHSENELKRAINIDYPIIGINNRNLNNFTVDINNTLKLIKKVPNDFTIVGESGIKKFQDIRLYNDAGVYNFLIGESILTSKNIQKKFDELLNK